MLEGESGKAAVDFGRVFADVARRTRAEAGVRGRLPNCSDAREDAARYYEIVWRTDHSYVSAAFGLARQRARAGDRAGAVAALDQVPSESAHFTAAAATAIEILLDGREAGGLDEQTLLDVGSRAAH